MEEYNAWKTLNFTIDSKFVEMKNGVPIAFYTLDEILVKYNLLPMVLTSDHPGEVNA